MNKHISYKGYKQLVGDNGVTEWVKFNWLSNPDAKYLWNVVDLGTLTWSHNVSSGRHIFTSPHILDIKKSIDGATTPSLFCSLYTTVSVDKPWVNLDMSYHTSSGADQVDIVNNAYTDNVSFKEAMKGVLLFYRTNWNKVDLGTYNWSYDSTNKLFTIAYPGIADSKPSFDGYCTAYRFNKVTRFNLEDKEFTSLGGTGQNVFIRDDDYTDTTKFKTAVSGVYLYYETN